MDKQKDFGNSQVKNFKTDAASGVILLQTREGFAKMQQKLLKSSEHSQN
jgi:hypothetical protein